MAKKVVVVSVDQSRTLSLPVGATAIEEGDLLCWNATNVLPMTADTDDATFIGVAGGKCGTGQSGDYIPVYTRCTVKIAADSATYNLGAGLKWSADNQVVADGNANTIGWVFDNGSGTRTTISMLIDTVLLGLAADKRFDTVSA